MRQRLFRHLASIAALTIFILISSNANCAHENNSQPKASEQRFDDISFWLKAFENPERDEWQKPDEVVKALKLKTGDAVADIGAGTGYFTRRLAVAVGTEGKAIGLDISEPMVQYMKEDAHKLNLKNYEAYVVKTDDPGLKPDSVDIVFICDTYHHLENRVDYLKRISPALKKNGRIVVVDFHVNTPVGPQEPGHKLAQEVVLEEFKQAGFRLIKSHDILPHQYFFEFAL